MNNKTLIIAEAGVNHNGEIKLAKKLIDEASHSGADYIKFQTFKAETLVTKKAKKAEYQEKLTAGKESHYDMIKKLELNRDDHFELIRYCKKKNIQFLSTGFSIDDIDFLLSLNIPFIKIPSGEINNLPYLRHISQFHTPVILSTGMSTMSEVKNAVNLLTQDSLSKKDITVLHCNTEYPTPFSDVNLNAMISIKEELNVRVGYSDHTLGIEVSTAATALGASIIEKHFTLDRNLPGPDHAASLEPDELRLLIRSIRNIEKALGNGLKEPSHSEMKNISVVRKSIIAKRAIKKGELFSEKNLTVKRPGNGISPMKWDDFIGKVARESYEKDQLI